MRLLLFAAVLAYAGTASAKTPQQTQPDIKSGCVEISQIRYRPVRPFALTDPFYGIEASVTNSCANPVRVFIEIQYVSKHDAVIGQGTEVISLSPGSHAQMNHQVRLRRVREIKSLGNCRIVSTRVE